MEIPNTFKRKIELYKDLTGKHIRISPGLFIDEQGNIIRNPVKKKKAVRKAPAKNLENRVSGNFQKYIFNFMDYMQSTGAMIASEEDIMYGKKNTEKLSDNGVMKFEFSDQAYNSRLVFSVLTALLDGKLFLLGDTGTGKTSEIAAYARFFYGTPYEMFRGSMVTCNDAHTFSDVFAYPDLGDLMGRHKENFKPRPVLSKKTIVKCFDEVEKTNKDIRTALLSWLADGYVSHRGFTISPPRGPFYFTANSLQYKGERIHKAFLDRMDMLIKTKQLGGHDASQLSDRILPKKAINRIKPMDTAILQRIKYEIANMPLDESAEAQLSMFYEQIKRCANASERAEDKTKEVLPENKLPSVWCAETNCKYMSPNYICCATKEVISTRTYPVIEKYWKGLAWLRGGEKATIEDLEVVLKPLLAHKLTPTQHAFDINQIFQVDQYAFVDHLWLKGGENYARMVAKIPNIAKIHIWKERANRYGKHSGIDIKEVEATMQDLKKIDSPVVYGLAIQLHKIRRSIS